VLNDETHESGTATTSVQVDGTVTSDPMKTYEEAGTYTIADDGIDAITLNGTLLGTL
jgi:hypothetical protein